MHRYSSDALIPPCRLPMFSISTDIWSATSGESFADELLLRQSVGIPSLYYHVHGFRVSCACSGRRRHLSRLWLLLHLGDLLVSEEVKVPIMREVGCQVEVAVVRTHLVQVRVQGLLSSTETVSHIQLHCE